MTTLELLMHLLGHQLEVSSHKTDSIAQQLISTRLTDAQLPPNSQYGKAMQSLQPWPRPPDKMWHDQKQIAVQAIAVLNWLSGCQQHDSLQKSLNSKLCWILASQVAGVCNRPQYAR